MPSQIMIMEKINIHTDIKRKLYHYYTLKKIPHILFYGENGCGKKTLVMDFIHLIYDNDKQKIRQNTLFSNCSHSKGIKHIRENLKEYSRSNVKQDSNVYFKTIILYNFENLSMDGQSALRRVIEAYSQSTRFFLILQNKNKILQPILSRFAHIYVPLPIIDGLPTNLYKYHLKSRMGGETISLPAEDVALLKEKLGGEDLSAPQKMIENYISISRDFYEKGYSCFDLLEFVFSSVHVSDENKSTILMHFHKIKSEYRNEKLLMLYMLEFIFVSKCEKHMKDVVFMM